ncbi:S41 family peptidase [Salinibacter ruber]|uniref:Carboxyl-terminal processing protease n=1 Tax=Salinibacter ruber TaxID=146919 RepID=A0AAW5P3C5_9BACT|nr:S41 family peptidase [Salinibacter ruber]MCS3663029.1 carboxyl-terminal processing protease [Salinibacter ruber]MCS4156373.1 carboxyl-terminal processing protease [Salinibacter ruber]MCS4222725.1 carboxyl-terminal processing protease [Salinibacter ruber]
MRRSRANVSLLGMALAVSMGMGVLVGFWAPDDDLFELRKGLRIFGAVYEEVVTGYVEPVDPGHLVRVGVDAMLEELDPYTTYVDESENARIDIITEGQYGGVGLDIGRRNGALTVVAPVAGGDAYQQGVRTGDVITEVAGQPAASLSVEDVEALLRGQPGTTVPVTVERAGRPSPLTLTLTRERVELPDVTYQGRVGAERELGYVKLERFTRDAPGAVESALDDLRDTGPLQGVVLDLRDNPGGLLRAAVRITALFVPQGTEVVSTRGRDDDETESYTTDRVPLLPETPVVVLVNGQSASASEIVAGALQDHDRGVVMGTTTYGKGLVQNVRSLPHNTALKLTTAQYYTPSGRTIQRLDANPTDTTAPPSRVHETTGGRTVRDGHGIRPDVRVASPSPSPLEQALTRRGAFFRYANHYAATHDTLAADFSVDESDLGAFRTWLDREDVAYSLRAERTLDSLRAQAEAHNYEGLRDETAALDAALDEAKAAAFDRHAPALMRHLRREILARYVSASRRIEALLPADEQVTAATDLLQTPDRYERLLTPEGSR